MTQIAIWIRVWAITESEKTFGAKDNNKQTKWWKIYRGQYWNESSWYRPSSPLQYWLKSSEFQNICWTTCLLRILLSNHRRWGLWLRMNRIGWERSPISKWKRRGNSKCTFSLPFCGSLRSEFVNWFRRDLRLFAIPNPY